MLRSLPEVDAERIAPDFVGRYLTCILAGVDSRTEIAVPVYGCRIYRPADLLATSVGEGAALDAAVDPSVYLPAAKIPMLWVNGTNDFAAR